MEKELLDFIKYHKLDNEYFFNANGQSISVCYNEMKLNNKLFAYNKKPNPNCGHTISDRQNRCIICDTSKIAFSLRKIRTAFVYIACSLLKEYSKIGFTTEPINKRLSKLNSRGVGNTKDWEILYILKCKEANEIELATQKELEKYRVKGDIYGDTESKEIFRCGFNKTKETLDKILIEKKVNIIEQKYFTSNFEKYNFKKLISK